MPRLRPALERAIPLWIIAWCALSAWKVSGAANQAESVAGLALVLLPYLLIALSPLVALRIAEAAFPVEGAGWRPRRRLAQVGRWRSVAADVARRHRHYGPVGLLASLVVGMLANIVLRSGEFLLSVPAVGPAAPDWARALFHALALEAAAMNFLYMVCFVMALRAVPAFPRVLACTWLVDIAFQLRTAAVVGSQPALPPDVATALTTVLNNNVLAVCISIALWLPYLLLSRRVNLTYRQRLALRGTA